ncbi:hypothetical protein V2W45_1360783 [Cenococcum geophilum]
MIMSSFGLLIFPSFPTISVRRPITTGGPSTTASLMQISTSRLVSHNRGVHDRWTIGEFSCKNGLTVLIQIATCSLGAPCFADRRCGNRRISHSDGRKHLVSLICFLRQALDVWY